MVTVLSALNVALFFAGFISPTIGAIVSALILLLVLFTNGLLISVRDYAAGALLILRLKRAGWRASLRRTTNFVWPSRASCEPRDRSVTADLHSALSKYD